MKKLGWVWLVFVLAQFLVIYLAAHQGFLRSIQVPMATVCLVDCSSWFIVLRLLNLKDASTFIIAYLGFVVLQLLVWVGYLAIILFLDPVQRQANTVFFLFNALVFIGLQTYSLFILRNKSV
ncbi:MAG: hypothetical protein MUF68_04000 [Cyclobacteriaceae bacterium]|jgi:hypothetical protein|nr:hypothetical protein [Cyclobacteriaceae bacterium]